MREIALNRIICEIHDHIETLKYRALTKVWNGMNSFIVYRIASSAVVPSLFICGHTDVRYVRRRKRTQRLFSPLFCLFLFWGRKRDLWHAEEHRAQGRCGALSPGVSSRPVPSPPPPRNFCFHPITTSSASSGRRTLLVCCCGRWSSFSPPLGILLLFAGGENLYAI